jgi:biopolymer transport protein ExbD
MWSDTKKKQVNQIGLIPLINVIFLLLIFFLVAGTVESIDTFEVDLPASNSGAPKTHIDAIIYLKENGQIAVNDDVIEKENLRTIIKTLFIENPSQKITIKSDAQSSASILVDVIEMIESYGGEEISLVTREVK